MAICSLCQRRVRDRRELLQHIRLYHADGANFRIQCKLQGCSRTFKTFSTYRNHLYAWHAEACFQESTMKTSQPVLEQSKNCVAVNATHSSHPQDECVITPASQPGLEDTTTNERSSIPQQEDYMTQDIGEAETLSSCVQNAAALWILKIQEQHLIPISTMNSIITGVDSLFQTVINEVHGRIKEQIHETSTSSTMNDANLKEIK